MSSYIHNEMFLFLQSVITGAALLLFYDILRAVRKVFSHSGFFVALEDLLYWMGCGLMVFVVVYRANQGILRFFLFLGIGLGAGLCYGTVSDFFVNICAGILKVPVNLLKFFIKWLIFPVRRCKLFMYYMKSKRKSDDTSAKSAEKGRQANWLKQRKREKKEK